MYPARVYIHVPLAVVSLKPTNGPSFKEDYQVKLCGEHKSVRVSEVVNMVCQV